MFRTLHAGCCKSITEFYASHARDGENSMCNERLHAVPERFTITWVDIRYCTFDDRSETVSLLDRLVKSLLPTPSSTTAMKKMRDFTQRNMSRT